MTRTPDGADSGQRGADRAARDVTREGGTDAPRRASRDGERAADASANERLVEERLVDETVEMTFPASDPPAWMSSGSHQAEEP